MKEKARTIDLNEKIDRKNSSVLESTYSNRDKEKLYFMYLYTYVLGYFSLKRKKLLGLFHVKISLNLPSFNIILLHSL